MHDYDEPKIDPRGLAGPEWHGKDADEVTIATSAVAGTADSLWKVDEYVERPAERVPVVANVDVVVAGAGVAGVIAAIAAARHGAETLVIDSFNTLGGNMGPGLWGGGSICGALQNPEAFPNGLGGIPAEFNERVVRGENRNPGSSYIRDDPKFTSIEKDFISAAQLDFFRDSQSTSYVATSMLEDAGGRMLLSSVVTGVIKEGNTVRGVFVHNRSGALAVRAKVVIDCTGIGDVAERAGAPMNVLPTNPSGGFYFAVADVDLARYYQAIEEREPLAEDDQKWLKAHAPEAARWMPWARRAWQAGGFRLVNAVDDFATIEFSPTPTPPEVTPPPGNKTILHCRTRVNGNFNPGDGLALSRINERSMVCVYEYADFLRDYVPGFEDAYLHMVSPFTHFRGGKSIDGEYVVTLDDVRNSARFDDVVSIFYDDKSYFPGGCDIPYRMLLPKKIEGLLAAGRSAVKRGPQIRQRHSMQHMGQAAGVAAALAVKHGVPPRDVDVRELQGILHSLGCELGPAERLGQLGIT